MAAAKTPIQPAFWRALLLLVVLGSCNSKGPERPAPGTSSTTLVRGGALESIYKEGRQRSLLSAVVGNVVLYTPEVWRVQEDSTLTDARPFNMPDSFELLDVRLTRLIEADGTRHPGGTPGGGCIESWPPHGFGRTIGAKGADLRAGETVALTFWLRVTAVGDHKLEGVRTSYATEGGAAVQEFEHSHNLTVHTVQTKIDLPPADHPQFPPPCKEPPPEWLR